MDTMNWSWSHLNGIHRNFGEDWVVTRVTDIIQDTPKFFLFFNPLRHQLNFPSLSGHSAEFLRL